MWRGSRGALNGQGNLTLNLTPYLTRSGPCELLWMRQRSSCIDR